MGFEQFQMNMKLRQEKSVEKDKNEELETKTILEAEQTNPETLTENTDKTEKEETPRTQPSPEEMEKAKEQIVARMMQGASQFFDVLSRRKLAFPEKKISFNEMEKLMEQTIFKDNLSGFKKEVSLYVKLYELDKLQDQKEFVKEFMKISTVNDLMGFELASKSIEATFKLKLQEGEQLETQNNPTEKIIPE